MNNGTMMDIYPLNLFELKKGVVLVYHALFRASCYPAKVAVDQYIILPGKVTFYFYFCNKHVFFLPLTTMVLSPTVLGRMSVSSFEHGEIE